MRSFLNYMGGKSRLARTIAGALPANRCYCEVFGGAGWVLFAKEPSPVEVLNDAHGRLINLYRVVRDRPRELSRALALLPRSRRLYRELLEGPAGEPVIDAAFYYYLLKNAFSGRPGAGFATSAREKPKYGMRRDFERWAGRLAKVTVENLDAVACVRRYDTPDTVFYLDPPYFNGARYYAVTFQESDHERLRDELADVDGRWLISYNDCREVRCLYKGFYQKTVSLNYCAAKVKLGERRVDRAELLIANFRFRL